MLMRHHVAGVAAGSVLMVAGVIAGRVVNLPFWPTMLMGAALLTYGLVTPLVEGAYLGRGSSIVVRRHVQKRRIRRGESVYVEVLVSNSSSRRYPVVRISDRISDDFMCIEGSTEHLCSLAPYGTASFGYVLRAMRRGMCPVGPLSVVLSCGSGGSVEETTVGEVDSILVLPKGAWAPRRRPSRRMVRIGRSASRLKGRGFDYLGTRRYEEGDEPRLIDWNLLARTGTPGTREFAVERGESVAFVIDVGPTMGQGYTYYSKLDSALETCTLLGGTMLARGSTVVISTGRGANDTRTFTPRERKRMFEHLALISTGQADDPGATLSSLLRSHPRIRRAFVFTDLENTTLLARAVNAARRKEVHVVVPALPPLTPPSVRGTDRAYISSLVGVLHLYESSRLLGRVHRLRRAGCRVVLAMLDDLPASVDAEVTA